MTIRDPNRTARRGEPSYLWRAGQERRLQLILAAAGERILERVFDDGCGVGEYLARLGAAARASHGVEVEGDRAAIAARRAALSSVLRAEGEFLPYVSASFDLVLSTKCWSTSATTGAAAEIVPSSGRVVCALRAQPGYPFETHGIYWRGRYRFGNLPLVNYLPRRWRDRLAPHVRAYAAGDVARLWHGLAVKVVERRVLFGAYDNIIARRPRLGRALRAVLQWMERTPLRAFGLSHFWVLEKVALSPGTSSDLVRGLTTK
jgi:SAM-dependent methyltransferase